MNSSFEQMWNHVDSSDEELDEHQKAIYASMTPVPTEFKVEDESDRKMMEIYKKTHAWNSPDMPAGLLIFKSKNICPKCLMHVNVCQTYGMNLTQYEEEQHAKAKERAKEQYKSKPLVQENLTKEQAKVQADAKAKEKADAKKRAKERAKAQAEARAKEQVRLQALADAQAGAVAQAKAQAKALAKAQAKSQAKAKGHTSSKKHSRR